MPENTPCQMRCVFGTSALLARKRQSCSGTRCYNHNIPLRACKPGTRTICRGVAQPGRAPGSGPGGRRFKSSLPDHILEILTIAVLPVCYPDGEGFVGAFGADFF